MDKAFSTVKESKSVNSLKGESCKSYRNEKNEEFAMSDSLLLCPPCSLFFIRKSISENTETILKTN